MERRPDTAHLLTRMLVLLLAWIAQWRDVLPWTWSVMIMLLPRVTSILTEFMLEFWVFTFWPLAIR